MDIRIREISKDELLSELRYSFYSAIGHKPTAQLLTKLLGKPIPFNRVPIALSEGDRLFVCQYIGSRLPEGTTKLPEGAEIKYIEVEL